MALMTVSGISKRSQDGFAVQDISFTLQPGEKLAIAGETGSGKTTLLQLMAGLAQPDAGNILFNNEKVKGPDEQLLPGHKGIAYLGQHFELRNNYWVHEILSYANKLEETEAANLYALCRIDHLLQRRTNQLSGGERQRIALAKLLTAQPRLLLLDEPFSNLDAGHTSIIKSVIHDISAQMGITCVLVSHHAADILSWADKVIVLQGGHIIQQGTPGEVYRKPVNEYAAILLGTYNLVSNATATVLSGVAVTKGGNKRLFLRPGQLQVTGSPRHALAATVERVLFLGAYYELHVQAGIELLRVYTGNGQFEKGDAVYLSLLPGERWYI